MSRLVAGESTVGKDGSLMSLVPHRMQNRSFERAANAVFHSICSLRPKKVMGKARVLVSLWGKGTKKVTTKQKEAKVTTN